MGLPVSPLRFETFTGVIYECPYCTQRAGPHTGSAVGFSSASIRRHTASCPFRDPIEATSEGYVCLCCGARLSSLRGLADQHARSCTVRKRNLHRLEKRGVTAKVRRGAASGEPFKLTA